MSNNVEDNYIILIIIFIIIIIIIFFYLYFKQNPAQYTKLLTNIPAMGTLPTLQKLPSTPASTTTTPASTTTTTTTSTTTTLTTTKPTNILGQMDIESTITPLPSTTTTTTIPTTSPTILNQYEILGIGILTQTALFTVITELFNKRVANAIGWEMVNTAVLERSSLLRSMENLGSKGARYVISVFKFGSAVTTALGKASAQELADLAAIAARNVGQAAARSLTAAAVEAAAMGPIGWALLIFQGISLALDISDAGGYNKLETWKKIKESMEDEIAKNLNGTNAVYPTTVGPLEALKLTPGPISSAHPKQSTKEISGVLFPDPSLLDVYSQDGANELLAKDPNYQIFLNNIPSLIQNSKTPLSDKDFSIIIDNFLNSIKPGTTKSYTEYYTGKAMDKICTEYSGTIMNDGTCMYTKDKCNQEMGIYEPGRQWSNIKNQCLTINAAMKDICDKNNMVYNIDKGICDITPDMCLKKDGVPKPTNGNSDGFVNECTVSLGIEICSAIFGSVICKGLDQIFNPNQYYPCLDGELDNGLMCMEKCKAPGYINNNMGLCVVPPSRLIGPANQCPNGYTSNGSSLCYPNCSPGYNFLGIDSNRLVIEYDTCVKDCAAYNMKNVAGICQDSCPSGWKDNGLSCTNPNAPYLNPGKIPNVTSGPRGISYLASCNGHQILEPILDQLPNCPHSGCKNYSCKICDPKLRMQDATCIERVPMLPILDNLLWSPQCPNAGCAKWSDPICKCCDNGIAGMCKAECCAPAIGCNSNGLCGVCRRSGCDCGRYSDSWGCSCSRCGSYQTCLECNQYTPLGACKTWSCPDNLVSDLMGGCWLPATGNCSLCGNDRCLECHTYRPEGACNSYEACDTGYVALTPGTCTWTGGLTSNCNGSDVLIGGLCYTPCDDSHNMRTVLGTCSPNGGIVYTKKTIVPNTMPNVNTIVANCGGNDNVIGSCYEKCPDGTSRVSGLPKVCSKDGTAGSSTLVPRSYWKNRKIDLSSQKN
jgi:hypothetical protein